MKVALVPAAIAALWLAAAPPLPAQEAPPPPAPVPPGMVTMNLKLGIADIESGRFRDFRSSTELGAHLDSLAQKTVSRARAR